MSSGKWDPFEQVTSLRDAMARLMDQSVIFGGQGGRGEPSGNQTVPVNIFEGEEFLMVIAAMPGAQQEDIEISARGNSLTIEARERGDIKPNETGKRYIRHEFRYGPYHRTVELPYAVDPDNAEATLGDGVLTVRLSKAATEKSTKINISAATGDRNTSVHATGQSGSGGQSSPGSHGQGSMGGGSSNRF